MGMLYVLGVSLKWKLIVRKRRIKLRIISEGSSTMKRMPLLAQAIVCDHCGCVFEYTLLDVHTRDEEGHNKTIYKEFIYCPWCSEEVESLSCKPN